MKSRRRWPWAILAVVLLLVGGPIAWRFRPLNETERRLVGTWRSKYEAEYTFRLDHSFETAYGIRGRWSVSGSMLQLRTVPDFPTSLVSTRLYWDSILTPTSWTQEHPIAFDGDFLVIPEAPDELRGFEGGDVYYNRM